MTFAVERRVRFAHVDAAGIAYFPRIWEMIDGAVEDWSRETLGPGRGATHLDRRLGTPVVDTRARFLRPSRLDDLLRLEVRVLGLGRSSLNLAVSGSCGGEVRFEAELRQVLVDLAAMGATPWPDDWRAAIGVGTA